MLLPENEIFHHLPLERILPNPKQPRKRFREDTLKGLAQSIQTQGIIQPLVVRRSKAPGYFDLVAGERRWRALQLTEITRVPCLIKEIDDAHLLEVALLENIQREELSPIEEAACYESLLKTHGYTQEELARRIGKNRSTVTNLIRLLQLPSAIQNDLEEGRITEGHARPLLALPSEKEQLRMRELLLKHHWSVRETERQVRDLLQSLGKNFPADSVITEKSSTRKDLTIELKNLEEDFQRYLGTKVSISYHDGKGSVKIDFYSLEEFERLRSLLLSSPS